ncbi:hypothetical protein AB0465_39790 [Streptomyces griseoviridis]|uniref:hypothetical protein n=1 Tax=Streptomyces griseoviridis TaxID=45398 RepID=UPI00344D2764
MADDDAGGTVYGFPGGLTIPGPVGSGPPPPGAAAPTLPSLPALAPPPSLLVAGNPGVGSGNTTAANADPGMPDSPQGSGVAAMSAVMMAGITVAAMRGAWNAAAYLKARHEHHRAIADQQRAAADKASIGVEAARQKGRLQSGPEFGRGTRTSGGGGGRTNSGKNNTPSTFRSSGGSKTPGGGGGKAPSKTPGGGSGGRTPTLGSGGRGGGGGGRRNGLEPSGGKGGGKGGSGGGKTPTTGTRNNSGGLSGAVRDRAADRVRNGPKPKTPTPTNTRTPGIRDAARDRAADRIRNGPKPKTPTTGTSGTGGKGTGTTKPDRGPRVRDAARARVADRITTGSWTPTGRKPVDLTKKGSGSSATPATIRGALRHRTVGRILNGKKPKPDPAAPPKVSLVKKPKTGTSGSGAAATPTTIRGALRHRAVGRILNGKKPKATPAAAAAPASPKVSLTKKPKTGTPGAGGPAAAPKVSLTKKPKPGPAGPGGAAPKVNLRKKVRLTKPPRRPGSGQAATGGTGTTGPKSTGPTSTGPKSKADKSRTRRGWWERASSRRSGRSEPDPSSTTSSGTTPGPGAAPGGGFGPPPGWGYTQGATITVEQVGGEAWTARRKENRRAAGVPAGAIPASRTGGTGVTVPVPTRAPSTQYADSDLTIYDVIDSDADMAEEIMAGVDEANAAAEGCEKMMTKLEALHQKIVDLKVPGVLEGWVLILAEKAVSVKAKAEALAEKLPAASEAIATAGENAARRHKPLADVTRDHGHAAPAERDYHVE